MAILKSQIFGRSYVGVYLLPNNSFVLYPHSLLTRTLEKLKSVFNLPLYSATVNNSKLLGIYLIANKYGMLVPDLVRDDELETLKSNVDNSLQIGVLKSLDNAFGNLILCNDKGAIISSLLKGHREYIEDILNVETVVYEFANSYLPGSISVANNKGCLVHPLSTDEEIEYISSVLKVETDVSTVNRGHPYLRAGVAVNDSNGVFGNDSTGPELMRLTSILQI